MQLTCFSCNATGSIEAFTKDEAAAELVCIAGELPPSLWRALQGYIGLFRTARKLPFDKAVRIAREVLALDIDQPVLELALSQTVEALRSKNGKPLKNHNYLKSVIETVSTAAAFPGSRSPVPGSGPASKANQAITALTEWAAGEWLRMEIAAGLSALVAQNLKKAPAADVITLNADIWFQVLKTKCDIEEIDAPRIRRGFEKLFPNVEEWPAPKLLLEHMPPRPERKKLRHEPSAEEAAAGIEMLRNYHQPISQG